MWEATFGFLMVVFAGLLVWAKGVGVEVPPDAEEVTRLPPVVLTGSLLLSRRLPQKLRAYETARLMPRIQMLQGPVSAKMNLELHLAAKCLHFQLGMLLACLLCLLGQADAWLLVCLVPGGLVLWMLSDQQLDIAYRERCRSLEREFPDFVCQVALLTGAGLHVRQALQRIVREASLERSLLSREVACVLSEMEGGMAEQQAWTELAERCRIREVSSLCGILMQHARLGGGGLARELRQMASDSWEGRKHAARRLGEEASSKLMLPLAILFIAVLMVCVTPAFLSLSGVF